MPNSLQRYLALESSLVAGLTGGLAGLLGAGIAMSQDLTLLGSEAVAIGLLTALFYVIIVVAYNAIRSDEIPE